MHALYILRRDTNRKQWQWPSTLSRHEAGDMKRTWKNLANHFALCFCGETTLWRLWSSLIPWLSLRLSLHEASNHQRKADNTSLWQSDQSQRCRQRSFYGTNFTLSPTKRPDSMAFYDRRVPHSIPWNQTASFNLNLIRTRFEPSNPVLTMTSSPFCGVEPKHHWPHPARSAPQYFSHQRWSWTPLV